MNSLERWVSHILKTRPDPLMVRKSTADVIQSAQFVSLHLQKIFEVSAILDKRIKNKELLTDAQFGRDVHTPQRVFLQDVINFYFWAPKGERKWTIEYPPGTLQDGWYGLTACFDRAMNEGIPILDARFLRNLSRNVAKHIFRGIQDTMLPFLDKRQAFLREAGEKLVKTFGGDIMGLLEECSFDGPHVARQIIHHFPSFQDNAVLSARTINFYKRAQIFVYDCSLLPHIIITNLDQLTVFADYKIPQLLRSYGIIRYTKDLVKRIDQKEIIKKDSREEIEIRSSTVWAGELIADTLHVSPVVLDNALWLLANETKRQMKPYHRTPTTNY